MRRQKTYHVAVRDRETGMAGFHSLRVHRSGKIVLNPTPGIVVEARALGADDAAAGMARLHGRLVRLGALLQRRTFREVAA